MGSLLDMVDGVPSCIRILHFICRLTDNYTDDIYYDLFRMNLVMYLSIHLVMYLSIHLVMYLYIHLVMYLSIHLVMYLYIHLVMYLYIHLVMYLYTHLNIHLFPYHYVYLFPLSITNYPSDLLWLWTFVPAIALPQRGLYSCEGD